MKFRSLLFFISVVFVGLVFFSSCGPSGQTDSNQTDTKKVLRQSIPVFSADSAFSYVKKQIDFGPRVPGSKAWTTCASWFESELKVWADTIIIQNFQARAFNKEVLKGRNIVAVFNPKAKKRLMLSSHWDSRPFADHDPLPENHRKAVPGANDGASGVGVLMEIARILSKESPDIGVDIVLFDLEDYGPPQDLQRNSDSEDFWGLGSQYWSRNPHIENYRAFYGILLDMVGVPEPRFLQEGFSLYYAPHIVKKVWTMASNLGYSQYFPQEQGGYITDDHYYVNKIAGIPTINIIHLEKGNNSFFKHWHTINDNLDSVDPKSLDIVGTVLLNLIYSE